jgi:hypothetical protein
MRGILQCCTRGGRRMHDGKKVCGSIFELGSLGRGLGKLILLYRSFGHRTNTYNAYLDRLLGYLVLGT